MNGTHAFLKNVPNRSLPSLQCEDREKRAVYEPGSWSPPDPGFVSTLILGFPASGTVVSVASVVYKPSPSGPWYFVRVA